MSRDEIIAMAREAGFRAGQITLSIGDPLPFIAPASSTSCLVEIEHFAALVAAKEREACAKEADERLHAGAAGPATIAAAIRARGTA